MAKKRAKAVRAKAEVAESAKEGRDDPAPKRAVPIWRHSFLYFALFHLVSAVALYVVMRDEPATFGWIFFGYLIVATFVVGALGVHRLRTPDPKPNKLDELHPREFFYQTWIDINEEARRTRAALRKEENRKYLFGPVVALTFGAICLTIMEYSGSAARNNLFSLDSIVDWLAVSQPDFVKSWRELDSADLDRIREYLIRWSLPSHDAAVLERAIEEWPWFSLSTKAWWAGWRFIGYFLMPAILIWSTRGRLRDNGLETKGFSEHAWIYAIGYYWVFVCVVIVSHTHEFSSYYPFYRPYAHRSWFDFFSWELLYALQFFSLEFFFRGWWLKSMKPAIGSYAIFAMVVPYCMIHYGKPFAETMGAILAGVFLGTLAMKTRSIWSGFLIHVSVAVSMDVASLLQGEGLPKVWFPDLP